MIYDLEPGVLLETSGDRILDEDELAEAKTKLAQGAKIETIAKQLHAHVWEPNSDEQIEQQHVAVPYDALVATLGEEKARELAGLPPAE